MFWYYCDDELVADRMMLKKSQDCVHIDYHGFDGITLTQRHAPVQYRHAAERLALFSYSSIKNRRKSDNRDKMSTEMPI